MNRRAKLIDMRNNQFASAWPLVRISECRRDKRDKNPAHSIGKPDVSPMTTRIGVRFATPVIAVIEIRSPEETTVAAPAI
jgi:hypothetical protein